MMGSLFKVHPRAQAHLVEAHIEAQAHLEALAHVCEEVQVGVRRFGYHPK
jgi:hypothetical protein